MQRTTFWGAVLAATLLAAGWAALHFTQESTEEISVSGFILLDNLPLVNADVFFIAEDGESELTSRFGRSIIAGEYQLLNGVKPSEYRVVVRKLMGSGVDGSRSTMKTSDIDEGQLEVRIAAIAEQNNRMDNQRDPGARMTSMLAADIHPLPDLYSSAQHTVLRVTVPFTRNETADFHLSSSTPDRLAAGPSASETQ